MEIPEPNIRSDAVTIVANSVLAADKTDETYANWLRVPLINRNGQ